MPETEPAPFSGVEHCVVFVELLTPTELEQTLTETVLDVAPGKPMLNVASVETADAPGTDAWVGDDAP